jgi:membrane dipeptidase
MNRRTFLKTGLIGVMVWAGGLKTGASESKASEEGVLCKHFMAWDAHAHPPGLFTDRPDPTTPTISMMKGAGLKGSVLAAVGDYVSKGRGGNRGMSPKFDTARQLEQIRLWVKSGTVKAIRSLSDLDRLGNAELGALIGIEGGDALEGRLENLDYFYEEYGVRIITLMHDTNNAIGGHQRSQPGGEGLTPFGQKVVERMNRLGMIIDVAHADTNTLRDITEITAQPVVDSHTDFAAEKKPFIRQRSWEEMEWVKKTTGVICTWPLSHRGRNTLADWAKEIVEMKSRLGMNHVGLGTDGGGRLPKTVEGYTNIGDLPKLIKAMEETGLDRPGIQAYLGGNFERVVRAVLK